MKVAVAGTGNVAQYLFEELTNHGHEVVVLTRKTKPNIKLEQRETDYSVASLITNLADTDALISTVADFLDPKMTTRLHLTMLSAIQQSTRCKTFIPSEWTLNAEDPPEQPMPMHEHTQTLHGALKAADPSIRWTIISNSWFLDYIVPQSQRHLRDIGPLWPMDHATKTFTIYGPGTQRFSVVAVRDVARAVAALLDSTAPWEQYTYVAGQEVSWNELFEIMRERDPAWKRTVKPLADTVRHVLSGNADEALVGYFELLTYSGASLLPRERVERDRARYFPGIKFRSIEEVLDDAAAARPGEIV